MSAGCLSCSSIFFHVGYFTLHRIYFQQKYFFIFFPHGRVSKNLFLLCSRMGKGRKSLFQFFPIRAKVKKKFFSSFPCGRMSKKCFLGLSRAGACQKSVFKSFPAQVRGKKVIELKRQRAYN